MSLYFRVCLNNLQEQTAPPRVNQGLVNGFHNWTKAVFSNMSSCLCFALLSSISSPHFSHDDETEMTEGL